MVPYTVGQVLRFTSHLNGQFACPNETVTYSCSVKGAGIIVGAVPSFSSGFSGTDVVGTTSSDARYTLTLIELTAPLSLTAQLQVLRATINTNLTCSNPSGLSLEVLPLILSCKLCFSWHSLTLYLIL